MAKEVAKSGEQELAQLEFNPFEAYGNQVSQTTITGKLLKFNKGEWLAGQDEEVVPLGTKLVANMDQFLVGWVKWVDNKPETQLMGLVSEAHQPPKRDGLGDLDQDQWEEDNTGKPRDPWQFTNYLILKPVGKKPSDENLYTLTTSSKGGIQAVGNLSKQYGKEMRQRLDAFPVVELGSSSYKHAEYGKIHTPVLSIVGWEPKSQFVQAADEKKAGGKKAA